MPNKMSVRPRKRLPVLRSCKPYISSMPGSNISIFEICIWCLIRNLCVWQSPTFFSHRMKTCIFQNTTKRKSVKRRCFCFRPELLTPHELRESWLWSFQKTTNARLWTCYNKRQPCETTSKLRLQILLSSRSSGARSSGWVWNNRRKTFFRFVSLWKTSFQILWLQNAGSSKK